MSRPEPTWSNACPACGRRSHSILEACESLPSPHTGSLPSIMSEDEILTAIKFGANEVDLRKQNALRVKGIRGES